MSSRAQYLNSMVTLIMRKLDKLGCRVTQFTDEGGGNYTFSVKLPPMPKPEGEPPGATDE